MRMPNSTRNIVKKPSKDCQLRTCAAKQHCRTAQSRWKNNMEWVTHWACFAQHIQFIEQYLWANYSLPGVWVFWLAIFFVRWKNSHLSLSECSNLRSTSIFFRVLNRNKGISTIPWRAFRGLRTVSPTLVKIQSMMHGQWTQFHLCFLRPLQHSMQYNCSCSRHNGSKIPFRDSIQQDFGRNLKHMIAFDGLPQHFPTRTNACVPWHPTKSIQDSKFGPEWKREYG